MNPGILTQILKFTTTIEKLKKMERFRGQTFWKDYPELKRYESVADHTWRLAVLLILIEDQLSKKIDIERALKMILIHDLPEIIAGDGSPMGADGTGKDTYAFNKKKAIYRHCKEKKAAKILFAKLPSAQGRELFDLWLEYEEQKSFESKVIKSLDRLECLLQVLEYRKGHLFEKHFEFNLNYTFKGSDIDPAIFKLGSLVKAEMCKKFHEFAN